MLSHVFLGQDVLRKYRPDLVGVPTSNGKWATGDGHVLVEEAGGHVVDMDDIQVCGRNKNRK